MAGKKKSGPAKRHRKRGRPHASQRTVGREGIIAGYAKLLDPRESAPLEPADPLLLYIAIIGMAEFFISAQPMILPLLPAGTSPDELVERYKEFVVGMVLNGLKPRRR